MKTTSAVQERARGKILAMYRADSAPTPNEGEEGGREGMNVLIADDDSRFRDALKRAMETKRGFHVWEAQDGEEAVEFNRRLRPNLVLMDLSMPRINGLEAMQLIRAERPDVCIIACSVHDDLLYRRAAKNHGADAFVSKSRCYSRLDWVENVAREAKPCANQTAER